MLATRDILELLGDDGLNGRPDAVREFFLEALVSHAPPTVLGLRLTVLGPRSTVVGRRWSVDRCRHRDGIRARTREPAAGVRLKFSSFASGSGTDEDAARTRGPDPVLSPHASAGKDETGRLEPDPFFVLGLRPTVPFFRPRSAADRPRSTVVGQRSSVDRCRLRDGPGPGPGHRHRVIRCALSDGIALGPSVLVLTRAVSPET